MKRQMTKQGFVLAGVVLGAVVLAFSVDRVQAQEEPSLQDESQAVDQDASGEDRAPAAVPQMKRVFDSKNLRLGTGAKRLGGLEDELQVRVQIPNAPRTAESTSTGLRAGESGGEVSGNQNE